MIRFYGVNLFGTGSREARAFRTHLYPSIQMARESITTNWESRCHRTQVVRLFNAVVGYHMQRVYIVHVWFQHKAVGTHTPGIFWQNRSSELYLKLERKHFSSFTSLLHCHLMLLAESPYRLLLSYYLQVTVGFGTGEITGEFAREQICFGGNSGSVRVPPVARANPSESRPALWRCAKVEQIPQSDAVDYSALCLERLGWRQRMSSRNMLTKFWWPRFLLVGQSVAITKSWTHFLPILRNCHPEMSMANWCRVMPSRMSIIVAVEMSSQPFKSFQFDGILGLGLPGLTMSRTVWTVWTVLQA